MDTWTWQLRIVYGLYVVWLIAGCLDFACHRRSDLPHTSGLPESTAHLFQLGVIGLAVAMVLTLAPTMALVMALLGLVVVHAVAGYVDTRIAFTRRRVITPIEQHLHSVLDIAPWAGWGAVASVAMYGDWSLRLRSPPLSALAWGAMLIPAVMLCVVPALFEFASARRAAARR